MFAFRIGFVLDKMREIAGCAEHARILEVFAGLPKISFDNAVVEKLCEGNAAQSRIRVVRYTGAWRDIGTWGAFTEIMDEPVQGNVIIDESCRNVNVINEMDVPVMMVGMADTMVTVTKNGILIVSKKKINDIRKYV